MLTRLHFLVALVAVICGSLPGALGFSVVKFFQPQVNIPPIVMHPFVDGEITYRIERMFNKVPNKLCVSHLRAMFYGIRNDKYWAQSMLDASAKIPEGFFMFLLWNFGNYEQCLRVQNIRKGNSAFSGQHCFVRICLTSGTKCVNYFHETVEKFVPILKKMDNPYLEAKDVLSEVKGALNTTFLRMGVCVPSTCSAEDLEVLANVIISQGTKEIHANVMPFECHTTKAPEYELLDYIALTIYSLMVALIISSTVYDLTHKDSSSRNEMYIVFSAYTNLKKMLTSSENSEGTLQCIHGIRFLSILYVILGHVYYLTPLTPITNIMAVHHFTRAKISSLMVAGYFSVDTFLLLSGLLVGYVFLNLVAETKTMNFKVFYIHRLVRLTPSLAAVLLFDISIGSKLGDGPFWHTHYTNDCKTTWWKVLFYVRNYDITSTAKFAYGCSTDLYVVQNGAMTAQRYRDEILRHFIVPYAGAIGDGFLQVDDNARPHRAALVDNMLEAKCMGPTWYLSADTQLYFLSPLLLIPLWKNPRRGQQLLAVLVFFSWLIPFTYAYMGQYKIPLRPAIFLGGNNEGTKGSLYLYSGTQNRFGPWVIGLWLGLILHRLRREQIIVKMTKKQVIAMWTYVFLAGVACVMSLHPFSQLEREYSRFMDSFYYSTLHLLWASVIFLIIFGCETGYGGPINWFLSLRLWIPWSRLTYGIYLVHFTVLYIMDASARTPQEFTHPLLIRKAISGLFLSVIAAAFVSLMFESPITAVERILLRKVRGKGPKHLPKDLEIRNVRPNGFTPILPGGDMKN
ncbi:nose resistant to fluoxetine protein 6 [Anabrus simplex]|uniref:nose resistant to fluoxetine protein 6 n=1 Tax=Anabrus simplex TaxID=316456 RepID=UPI0035A28980